MSTVTFTAPDLDVITVDTPQWGYTSTLKLPLWYSERADGSIGIYDAGTSYDRRVCDCVFQLNATDTAILVAFCRNSARGRGNSVKMTLSSGSGFFPFGPDFGDPGDLSVQWIQA
jgi:hypothetical protein